MKRLRMIYATILVVIYVAASLFSSLAVLTCDHPHHTHISGVVAHCSCGENHHHDNHDSYCNMLALDRECCDHEHDLLGENYTEYIAEKQRVDDDKTLLYAFNTPAIVAESVVQNPYIPVRVEPYRGDEQLPLQAAFSRYDSLRAPPTLA